MALTDNCDVFGAVHEAGLNRMVRHLLRQRPSLFNYGTDFFVADPRRMCERIDAHPEVSRRGNPLITREDPLPIIGTGGAYGVDFCLQLTDVEIDFHPGNVIGLPPELGALAAQQFALRAKACAGIVCPDADISTRLGDQLAPTTVWDGGSIAGWSDNNDKERENEPAPPPQPVPGREVVCFCLEVFATLHFELTGPATAQELVLRLDGLEIVDIEPQGLEHGLECYLSAALRIGILPRLRFALQTFVFDLGSFASLSLTATPISAAVPNNPAVEDDQLKVFVDVVVGP